MVKPTQVRWDMVYTKNNDQEILKLWLPMILYVSQGTTQNFAYDGNCMSYEGQLDQL